MKKVLEMLRLNQKTTWAGIIAFACTVFGWSVKPELATEIATIGTSIACILIGYNEK